MQLHRYDKALEHRQGAYDADRRIARRSCDRHSDWTPVGGYLAFLRQHAQRGDVDDAFRWLQRAIDDTTRDLIFSGNVLKIAHACRLEPFSFSAPDPLG